MKRNIIYKNKPEFFQDPTYLGFINKDDLKKVYSNALAFFFFQNTKALVYLKWRL